MLNLYARFRVRNCEIESFQFLFKGKSNVVRSQ